MKRNVLPVGVCCRHVYVCRHRSGQRSAVGDSRSRWSLEQVRAAERGSLLQPHVIDLPF